MITIIMLITIIIIIIITVIILITIIIIIIMIIAAWGVLHASLQRFKIHRAPEVEG